MNGWTDIGPDIEVEADRWEEEQAVLEQESSGINSCDALRIIDGEEILPDEQLVCCDCCGRVVPQEALDRKELRPDVGTGVAIVTLNGHERHWVTENDGVVTTHDGLLYKDGRALEVGEADAEARRHGFAYAEQLVDSLEGNGVHVR